MTQESGATSAQVSYSFRKPTRHDLKVNGGNHPPLKKGLLHAFRRSVRQIPEALFDYPLLEPHHSIEERSFQDPVHQVPVKYYVSRAPVERGVVVACTGLKEPISLEKKRIQQLNDQGISYICLRLPNFGDSDNIMSHYEQHQKFFYLDENSPVHQIFPRETKKFIQAHSTGGQTAIILATHPDTRKEIADNYHAIYADAPFMDSPNSSQFDSIVNQAGFTAYALLCGKRLPEDVALGMFYLVQGDIRKGKIRVPENARSTLAYAVQETAKKLHIKASGGQAFAKEIEGEARGLEGRFRLPTFSQILEIRSAGRSHKNFLEKNGVPTHLPIHIYADVEDDFSSYKAAKHWAGLIGAELIESKGVHNQLNKDENAFNHFLSNIEAQLPAWPEPETIINEQPLQEEPAATKGWHDLPPVQTILTFSRESYGRLFNAASQILRIRKQPEAEHPAILHHRDEEKPKQLSL